MSTPARAVRDAVQDVWRAHAQAELAWLRHGTPETPWRAAANRLFNDEGESLWQEAGKQGELAPHEHAALQQQRAAIAAQLELAPARAIAQRLLTAQVPVGSRALPLAQLMAALLTPQNQAGRQLYAQALAGALVADAPRLCELQAAATAQWQALAPASVAAAALHKLAAQVLSSTDAACAELTRRAMHAAASAEETWAGLLFALRRHELDSFAGDKRRPFRLSEGLRQLGFERDMSQRMRAESSATLLSPTARLVVVDAPSDVRVVLPAQAFGVLGDVHAAEAIARAVAIALVSPALAMELRWPLPGRAAAVFGALHAQLRADRLYLRRTEGLATRDAETVARHAALVLLLQVRSEAALLLSAAAPARNTGERREHLVTGLQRALGVEVPAALAVSSWLAAPPNGTGLVAQLCGLGLHVGLREQFDEDWFQNPRVAEPLRGACARGNTLTSAAFCEELGASIEQGCGRLLELVA